MSRTAVLRTIAASIFLCMSSQVSAADPLLDVKLGDKGRLQARLVNEQGKALAKSPVRVLFRGKTIAKTQTDQRGFFTIRGLRGGAHIVECGGLVQGCRLWTAKAAPPNAQPQLLLVRDSRIIRAQTPADGPVVYGGSLNNGPGGSFLGGPNFQLGAAIVTSAAVMGGVIGFNHGLDRRPPASP